ncbi:MULTISPECIES: sel1 repeat family protein [unclassified Lysobacter]|uniref:sel1 repeat family protein n=1 Tax=unclassified Lysobacter TaxID=2635362 RepID=UPI0006F7C19E|nr:MULTISPECIES: sel1 repeat family protein [unclassified Lysobacter]
MRGWILCLALLAAPAMADELEDMNAVSQAWDRFAQLSSERDPDSVALLSQDSLRYMTFLRDAALYASPDQVRRIPMTERAPVYAMRATLDEAKLAALDGEGVARHCTKINVYGLGPRDEGERLPTITHVTLIPGDRAIGELGPPNGEQYQYGPEFKRENGQWKVRFESMVVDNTILFDQELRKSGLSENEMMELLLNDLVGELMPVVTLSDLDRPLRDDAAARTRLNEIWPDYRDSYRSRMLATERKAADGEDLAMLGLGALLYSGAKPEYAPQDKPRGLKLLEQASDKGNTQASLLALLALTETYRPAKGKVAPPDVLNRMAVHSRRAAEGGIADAMVSTATFTFNGVGGPRDCKRAEEWAARAEDAGAKAGRNERVWYLATCPIPDQRDPKRALELAAYMIERADTIGAGELDTVAAAYAANARFAEAGDYQRRAIAKLGGDDVDSARRMKQRLNDYKRGKDWVQDYNYFELPGE